MAITRSFGANGQFELVDYTEELLIVPNQWGLVNSLGIFTGQGISENSITVEKISESAGLVLDRVRGERAYQNKDFARELHSFPVPHFPLDDYITPQDVQGKRAYGEANAADTLAAVRARKLQRLRQSHAWTLEAARCQALTAGTVYAPNGTVSVNWFTSFGVSQKTVDFVLGTGTTNIVAKIEEVIAHIQDNLGNGGQQTGIMALCSPEFFSALIAHDAVKAAYQFYASTQEPLRQRQGGNTTMYREFFFGGCKFVEYRGNYNGSRLIPVKDAVFIPMGVEDMFETYFAPANKFDFVNTVGEEAYVFEYTDPMGEKVELQSQANFINMLRRPAGVVRGFTA
jgi:hypothetical protein